MRLALGIPIPMQGACKYTAHRSVSPMAACVHVSVFRGLWTVLAVLYRGRCSHGALSTDMRGAPIDGSSCAPIDGSSCAPIDGPIIVCRRRLALQQ